MKIISLEAENIKRLTAVRITPDGNVIQITGKNGEGKTSVIDAIWMALGGKQVKDPIHKGAEKGFITIDLGRLIVKRTYTGKGSYLSVETADGAKYGSPQKMLDDLIGQMSFDPTKFMRLKDQAQYDELAEYTGIDLSEFSINYERVYTERRDTNRDMNEKIAEFKSMQLIGDTPDKEIDMDDLINEINAGREHNQAINIQLQDASQYAMRAAKKLEEIVQAEETLKNMRDEYETMVVQLGKDKTDAETAKESIIDIAELETKLKNSQLINANVRNNLKYHEVERVIRNMKARSNTMTQELDGIKDERTKIIQDADMPIDGLGFGKGFVTYNDIPLSQASSAEQIRVTVAIAMAMNPDLRVIRIEDGSLLDSVSMAIIEEMAKDNDYQIWIERVDESGKVGVLIEDGQVAAIDGKKVEKKAPAPKKKTVKKKAAPKKKADQVSAQKIDEMKERPSKPVGINKINPSLSDGGLDPIPVKGNEVIDHNKESALKPVEQIKPEKF